MTPYFRIFLAWMLFLAVLVTCSAANAAEYTIPLRQKDGRVVQITVDDGPGLPRLKACIESDYHLQCVDVNGNTYAIPFANPYETT